MADYKEIFKTAENQNWLKCCYAIQVVRQGLLDFCTHEIGKFHTAITSKLPQTNVTTCTNCKTSDVIPYSKPGHSCRVGKCRCPSSICVFGVCHILKAAIEKEHRYKHISWKNTNIAAWLLSPWEIAKCYFPPDGYKRKMTAEETDLNGIISLIKNNTIFERLSSLQNFETTFDRVSNTNIHVYHTNILSKNAGKKTKQKANVY